MSEAVTIERIPDPYSLPIESLTVIDPVLFQTEAHWKYFERLRKEDPVHLADDEDGGHNP